MWMRSRFVRTAGLALSLLLACTLRAGAEPVVRVLDGVPEYRWNYGCTPTSAGMLMGYWDRLGLGNLVADEATLAPLTSGAQPAYRPFADARGADDYRSDPLEGDPIVDALIASVGHHRDYWAHDLGPGQGAHIDPMLAGHADDSLADYLGTSRGRLENGSTLTSRVGPGLQRWVADRGYGPATGWAVQTQIAGANPFSDLRRQINRGAPALLHLSLDGRGGEGHTVLAYGYRDNGPGDRWVALRDTWLDGDSTGRYAIDAEVDADGVEWWRLGSGPDAPEPRAYAFGLDSLFLLPARPERPWTILQEDFEAPGTDSAAALGYAVVHTASAGSATLVESFHADGGSALRLSSEAPGLLVFSDSVLLAERVELAFDYRFETPVELELGLGSATLARWAPADLVAGQVGHYQASFDVAELGLAALDRSDLYFLLRSPGAVAIDGLHFWAVPEPAALALLAVALATLRRR